MAVDEGRRHQLFVRLEAVLGPDEAATLMSGLPPTGWTDLVTKDDLRIELALLEARLNARIDGVVRVNILTNVLALVTLAASFAGISAAVG